jgi:hypothetical protein
MFKNLSSQFIDLDIENPLGRGTLAKVDPPLLFGDELAIR